MVCGRVKGPRLSAAFTACGVKNACSFEMTGYQVLGIITGVLLFSLLSLC